MLKLAFFICCLSGTALAQAEPTGYQCGGTEPFWDLRVDGETAALRRMGRPTVEFGIPHKAVAEGRNWPIAYSLIGDFGTAVAVIRPAVCSDGMSDIEYPFVLDLLTQDGTRAIVLTGCCLAGKPAN